MESKWNFLRNLPTILSWYGAAAFKAFPLDMSQYGSLFGGSRIPRKDKDVLHSNRNSRHFLAMRNGNFYSVDLFDASGNLLAPQIVHACLAKILQISPTEAAPPEESVGSLTTLERDRWASVREKLSSLKTNAEALQKVDDALFLLALDDLKSEDHSRLVASLLCGDNGANRW